MRWWDVNQFQCRELFGMKCGLQKEYSIAQIGTFQSNTCIGIRDDCEYGINQGYRHSSINPLSFKAIPGNINLRNVA